MMADQLALFAPTWSDLFERAEWVAPHDCHFGPAGTVVLGWRCPDPDCRQVEATVHVLNLNHGFDPLRPQPVPPRCTRLVTRDYRASIGLPALPERAS